eukprot:scaffold18929_cov36-Phaeocystis_antarctica.AAC.1
MVAIETSESPWVLPLGESLAVKEASTSMLTSNCTCLRVRVRVRVRSAARAAALLVAVVAQHEEHAVARQREHE